MGVVQARNRARLLLEAMAELRILGKVVRQDFDGHGALEPRVSGFIDLAHAPSSNGRGDFVRA